MNCCWTWTLTVSLRASVAENVNFSAEELEQEEF
jgi:hypothetical protein